MKKSIKPSKSLLKSLMPIKEMSPTDIGKLMHELHVYQIELEMQNEELRKAQLSLEDSRNRYMDLYDFAPVGYFILDKAGVINEVNLAGAHILDVERRHLIKIAFFRFISSECQEIFQRFRERVFATGVQQTCELKLVKKDGTQIYSQLIGVVVHHTTETYQQFRLSVTDITQRYEAEKLIRQRDLELAHFSRINTIGEMASGIAHELNQPLTAIVHYTGGCLARLRDENVSSDILEMMERVMTQAERAGTIIHRLKAFLKKEKLQTTLLQINEVIRSTLDLMEYEIRSAQIKIQLEFDDSLPMIKGDQIQLQQVILNIIHNAIEATQTMKSKQKIIIQTRQSEQKNVEIIIADTGQGIPRNQIDKIFDPFFTTKLNGMGMGLCIARSIVEMHGGRISAVSDPSSGTRFHVFLPVNC